VKQLTVFGRGFLIVSLTASNVGQIAAHHWGGAFVGGLAISFVWWGNSAGPRIQTCRGRASVTPSARAVGRSSGCCWCGGSTDDRLTLSEMRRGERGRQGAPGGTDRSADCLRPLRRHVASSDTVQPAPSAPPCSTSAPTGQRYVLGRFLDVSCAYLSQRRSYQKRTAGVPVRCPHGLGQ
jgi:hypothetical protein